MNTEAGVAAPPDKLSPRERQIELLVERIKRAKHEPDIEALLELTDLLPDNDGEPLESPWHFNAIALLKDTLAWHWRDRDDYFVGGNMFVYYNPEKWKPQF